MLKRLPIVFILVLFFVLAACGGTAQTSTGSSTASTPIVSQATEAVTEASTASASAAQSDGDTLRLLYWQAPTTVNPHLSAGTKDLSASRIAYEPLANNNAEGALVPILAAEIPSLENGGLAEDGLSVTWKLKEGVRWADGEPFTAEDVVFTFAYVSNPDVGSTSAPNYTAVAGVEAVDDFTVKVTFKNVNPSWDVPFVGSQGSILPKHIFEAFKGSNAADAPANLQAIGTGPYYVDEFRTEDILIIGGDAVKTIKIIYLPNPYYREEGKPYFSRLELLGGGVDAVTAAQAIKNGDADFAWNLAVDDATLADMESDGGATAIPIASAFSERIMLNFTDPNQETDAGERSSLEFPHPFLTDLTVRQAIAHAIDYEAIGALYGRSGVVTHNLLVAPENYTSSKDPYEFDLEEAARLLDEAGWVDSDDDGIRDKDGVSLTLSFQTSINPQRQQTQEIVKDRLESIGFKVELKEIDSSVFLGPPEGTTNTRRQFYTDLEEFAFSNKVPDPGAYMRAWTCDTAAQMSNNWSGPNWSRYCNPDYDALYEQSTTEMDPEARRQLFVQMNEMLTENVAVIPLIQVFQPVGVVNSIEGLNITPWDVEVWNIADWRRSG
jgi:peptide/nickel transport system substrate-binding protein